MSESKRTETVCSNCGGVAKVKVGKYRFEESGLKDVFLMGIELIKCQKCGNVDPVIPAINQLMQFLVIAVAAKPCKLDGQEIRFLRKYLKMTGDQFSAVLGTDKTTVSKWENDEQDRGERADLLIRAVVMALGEGLSQYSERVVRGFPAIEGVWRELRYEIDPEARTCDYVS